MEEHGDNDAADYGKTRTQDDVIEQGEGSIVSNVSLSDAEVVPTSVSVDVLPETLSTVPPPPADHFALTHGQSGSGVINRGYAVDVRVEQPVARSDSSDVIVRMDDDVGVASSSRRLCGGGSMGSSASDSDTADDAPLLYENRTDVEADGADKPASPHDRFPKERPKALMTVVLLVFAACMNEITLSFVHEKVPADDPLPDITFSHTPYFPQGLQICEHIMLVSFGCTLFLIFMHRHRWIVLRRLMFIGSLLYLMRCVTMIVTQVPVADKKFHCAPKFGENGTFWQIVLRGLKGVAGVGLNVQGENTLCGDYIYSGHTIVLTISALFINEYSPRRWWWLHGLFWVVALVGVIFLVISRGHYTVDVILSYYVCTRLFWTYHTLASVPTLRQSTNNQHCKEYWYPIFRVLESQVQRPVPRRFESPIPLGRLRSLFRIRNTNARIE